MAYDLISKIDINAEVNPEDIQDAMYRIRGFMLREWPDLDTSPSSPFGNLVLQPLSKCLVIVEQTLDCVLSDVQLENALNGIVCDCEFIQAFLKGLGVTTLAEANCTGWARWKFVQDPVTTNGTKTIDRGVNMSFAGNIFHIYAPYESPINLIDSNAPIDTANKFQNNARVFNSADQWATSNLQSNPSGQEPQNIEIQIPNEWYVDLPIYGPSTASLSAGTLAEIDQDLPYFSIVRSVELLDTITPFEVPTDLDSLIKLVRTIQPSANITTRGNATSYVLQKFPLSVGVSPVLPGDIEMSTRATDPNNTNNYNIYLAPFMDLYVKSLTTPPETQNLVVPILCKLDSQGNLQFSGTNNLFYPGHELLTIGNLYYEQETEPITILENGDLKKLSEFITCTPNTDALSYNIQLNGLKAEYLQFPSDTNFPLENGAWPSNLGKNDVFYFRIDVGYDKLPLVVSNAIQSPDVSPALNVMVRPFVTCTVEYLNVTYRKDTGKFFDRQQAISQIYALLNSLTYPTQYSDAYIGDIMMSNGAAGITDVETQAIVRYQVAAVKDSRIRFDDAVTVNTLNVAKMLASNNNLKNFGVRNVQYIVPREAIVLIEKP
jgi:hypothetical protein